MTGDGLLIGEQVAYWRRRRGKSQRVLAGLAGISQPYLSQIETGHRTVERRGTLVALADALSVSVSELTGRPGDPTDPARARAAASMPAIRETLIMREAGERVPMVGDLDALLAARAAFDFAAAAPMLPGLLGGATGVDLVQVGAVAASVFDQIGYQDLARDAARLCVTAGRGTGDPAWLAAAELTYIWCLPPESRFGPPLASRMADRIQAHCGAPRVRRVYGMLHLLAALRYATLRRREDALDHLREADDAAKKLGEPDDWHDLAQSCFGPTNVSMWRVAVLAELGDSGEALAATDTVNPELIPLRHRRASFLVERMAILANARRDGEAIATVLRAESLCPQWVRLRPVVRDTVRVIWRRTRHNAVGKPLRRAAAMVGLRTDR